MQHSSLPCFSHPLSCQSQHSKPPLTMGREGSDLSLLPRKGAGRDQRPWGRGRGQRPGQQALGQAHNGSVKAIGAFSGRLRIKMLCSPRAQGHKWLTKGSKNLIAAWIKEGRGGRGSPGQRERGSLGGGLSCLLSCLWQKPSFWPLSQVSNTAPSSPVSDGRRLL